MATVINAKENYGLKRETKSALKGVEGTSEAFECVRRFLPIPLCREIDAALCDGRVSGRRIEEIRIRSGRRTYLTVGGYGEKRNLLLNTALLEEEVSDVLQRMCDGSLYAYGESIVKGYITLGGGIRVGVCGRARVEDGKILGVCDISALNIRLPCLRIERSCGILRRIRETVMRGDGVLIYSPPAQGKTTLLRSLSYELSSGAQPLRVALVDSREEIGGFLQENSLCLDVLSGYPQAEGIRIATAFMNPQVIICDEIGSEADARAIAQAQNSGVPLIASAHGSSVESIFKRDGMKYLHNVGAFGLYVGVRIGVGGFEYRVSNREEIRLENTGNSGSSG